MVLSINSSSIGAILVHILFMVHDLQYHGYILKVRLMMKRMIILDTSTAERGFLKFYLENIVILLQYKNSHLSSVTQNSYPFKYCLFSIPFFSFFILLILSSLYINCCFIFPFYYLSVRPPKNFPLMILVQLILSSSTLNHLFNSFLMLIISRIIFFIPRHPLVLLF